MKKIILSVFFFKSAFFLCAQTDTLRKYPNGNILLQQQIRMRLMSPAGLELANWDPYKQNIKQWGKNLNIAERTDSTGKTLYGVVDELTGRFVVPPDYESISRYNAKTGVYLLRQPDKYGFYAPQSGRLTPAEFNYINRHINLDWQIACNSKAGYIYDEQLRLIDSIPGMIDIQERIRNGTNEWLELNLTGCRGLLDVQNKLIVKKEWKRIYAVRGRTAIVKSDQGVGLFDITTGLFTMPYKPYSYKDDRSSEGRIVLLGSPKSILLDNLGKPYLYFSAEDVEFSPVYQFGGFYFKDKGLWGLMNNKGQIIQKPIWEYVSASLPSIFTARYPDQSTRSYYLNEETVNGQHLLTGIRQLSPEEVKSGYVKEMEQIVAVRKEEFMVTNLPDAPGPPAAEEQNKIYQKMEIDPSFPRGSLSEAAYLKNAIDQYKNENKIKKTGKVTIKLVIEKDGAVSLTEIVSSADASLTEASKAILKAITRWTPGQQNGRPVRGEKTLVFEW